MNISADLNGVSDIIARPDEAQHDFEYRFAAKNVNIGVNMLTE